jgi:hypothetical protein
MGVKFIVVLVLVAVDAFEGGVVVVVVVVPFRVSTVSVPPAVEVAVAVAVAVLALSFTSFTAIHHGTAVVTIARIALIFCDRFVAMDTIVLSKVV